jgi:GDP-D-mannose dehydratase
MVKIRLGLMGKIALDNLDAKSDCGFSGEYV